MLREKGVGMMRERGGNDEGKGVGMMRERGGNDEERGHK